MIQSGIDKAIEAAGGQEQLGAALVPPISQQAVAKMKAQGWASPDRALEMARLYDIPIGELVNADLNRLMDAARDRPQGGSDD